MIKYQYQVLRYMHDQFTGEFVNVGVVLYSAKQEFLKAKCLRRYSRISRFFTGVNGDFLLASLKRFEQLVEIAAMGLKATSAPGKINEITSDILIKDDSSLQLSTEIFTGLEVDLHIALTEIFERTVEKYFTEESDLTQTDKTVWSKLYKQYFDQQGITEHLEKHSFSTSKDTIEFDKTWKNGVWNCYQPLSLDLKGEDSIKNKVYRWFGVIKQLETSEEAMHLYFLASSPNQHQELKPFIMEMLGSSDDPNIRVNLIDQNEAEEFVATVHAQMVESGKISEASNGEFQPK
jgi:Protein of unknown function (DUF3037)